MYIIIKSHLYFVSHLWHSHLLAESYIQYDTLIPFFKINEQNISVPEEADLLVENKQLILTTGLKFCGCET